MMQREFNIRLPDIPARASIELETTTRVFSDGSVSQPMVERWTSRCLDCGRLILADGRCGCFWRSRDAWLRTHHHIFGFFIGGLNMVLAIWGGVQLATGILLNPNRIGECQLLMVFNLSAAAVCLYATERLRRARRHS
jgi:hypothetical protein